MKSISKIVKNSMLYGMVAVVPLFTSHLYGVDSSSNPQDSSKENQKQDEKALVAHGGGGHGGGGHGGGYGGHHGGGGHHGDWGGHHGDWDHTVIGEVATIMVAGDLVLV